MGQLELIKLLLVLDDDRRIDVHADDEYAFRCACEERYTEIVKFLLELEGDRPINVHANDEYAFRLACQNGQVKVIKMLIKLDHDRRIPEEIIPSKYLPATPKRTIHKCIVTYDPIEENEKYLECVANSKHIVKYSTFFETGFNTCVYCRTNEVKLYINK